MNESLFIYTREKLSLMDSLSTFAKEFGENKLTAILYTPRRCELATFDQGTLQASDCQSVNIASVFEARLFNETAELRWLNDPGSAHCHRTVVLTEKKGLKLVAGWGQDIDSKQKFIKTLPQTYLIWGEGTGRYLGESWSELATARIGGLNVPLGEVGKKSRVLLRTKEYIVESDHGNAVVFDERLLKLEVDHG